MVFECNLCQKKVKSKGGLTRHLKWHSADRPVKVRKSVKVSDNQNETSHGSSSSVGPVECNAGSHLPESCNDDCNEDETGVNVDELELCDIPDDDEMLSQSDNITSYFFENDDELDDYLSSLPLEENAQVPVLAQSAASQKTKKKPVANCDKCGRAYVTIDAYLKHRATHAMTDLYFHSPNENQLAQKCFDLVNLVLDKMSNSEYSAHFAPCVKTTAKHLKQLEQDSEEWLEIVSHIISGVCEFFKTCSKYLVPSELRQGFQRHASLYCANKDERNELASLLLSFTSLSKEEANIFLGIFLRLFCIEVLSYYVHFMLTDGEDISSSIPLTARFAITQQPTDTLDFKQLMHFVGGANVKSILRTAFKIKNPNHEWLKIIEVVKKYFLISELAAAPDKEIMAWTEAQDRGGLTKICDKLLRFFVELGASVKILEHFDGSLYVDEVMQKVLSSGRLLCLWDNTLQGSPLTKEESFKLLHALCSHFCCTWRRGIITRRLDELSAVNESVGAKHGQAGVAFRASLK